MLFNSEFVPRMEAAIDHWQKAGKSLFDPNSPIQKKNVDAMIEQLRPARQMARDQLTDPKAEQDPNARAAATDPSDGFLPAPPRGVDWNAWVNVVSRPTTSPRTGQPFPFSHWAKQVNILLADPSAQNIRFFNRAFGHAGLDGTEVLRALRGRQYQVAPEPAPSAPPAPAPAPAAEPDSSALMGP